MGSQIDCTFARALRCADGWPSFLAKWGGITFAVAGHSHAVAVGQRGWSDVGLNSASGSHRLFLKMNQGWVSLFFHSIIVPSYFSMARLCALRFVKNIIASEIQNHCPATYFDHKPCLLKPITQQISRRPVRSNLSLSQPTARSPCAVILRMKGSKERERYSTISSGRQWSGLRALGSCSGGGKTIAKPD